MRKGIRLNPAVSFERGRFPLSELLCLSLAREIVPALVGQRRHVPTVLTRQELASLLENWNGTSELMAELLYGAGFRLMECVCLRVKDIDFGQNKLWFDQVREIGIVSQSCQFVSSPSCRSNSIEYGIFREQSGGWIWRGGQWNGPGAFIV